MMTSAFRFECSAEGFQHGTLAPAVACAFRAFLDGAFAFRFSVGGF